MEIFQNVQIFWKYVEEVLQKIMKFLFPKQGTLKSSKAHRETGKSSKAFSINLKVPRHVEETLQRGKGETGKIPRQIVGKLGKVPRHAGETEKFQGMLGKPGKV